MEAIKSFLVLSFEINELSNSNESQETLLKENETMSSILIKNFQCMPLYNIYFSAKSRIDYYGFFHWTQRTI